MESAGIHLTRNLTVNTQQKEKQNESKNAVIFVGMIKLRNSSSLYEIKLNTFYTLHITSLFVIRILYLIYEVLINTNFRVILKAMWKRHMWNRPLVPNISADHRFHCIINVHTTAYLANAVSERQLLGVHARECESSREEKIADTDRIMTDDMVLSVRIIYLNRWHHQRVRTHATKLVPPKRG